MRPRLSKGDALVVVDVQKDFCPGGRLPVMDGDAVVPVLNRWIAIARVAGVPVVITRDWHPPSHKSFESMGGSWPEHCVQGTAGAQFHDDLAVDDDVLIISKGAEPDHEAYSAFAGTSLLRLLRGAQVRRVFLGGLALDYCVKQTALDGLQAGFEIHVIADGSRPVDVHMGDGVQAISDLAAAGAIIEEEKWLKR